MMILRLLIALLLIPSLSLAGQGMGPGPGVGRTYSAGSTWMETFEGTGYVNAVWTETGTPNEDYTAAPLVGSQSASLAYGDVVQSSDLGAFTQVKFVVKIPTLDNSTDAFFFGLRDSSAGTTVASISVTNLDRVKVACGTSTATSTGTITAGAQYVMWLEYTKGNGSTGVAKVYVTSDSGNDGVETKPGAVFVDVTDGSSTLDAATFRLLNAGGTFGGAVLLDNVEIVE